ncbi:MAG: amidase, partial [Verrucomicrobia bacterium]|nr:amidase [Verrucomicrobiota bacterium]
MAVSPDISSLTVRDSARGLREGAFSAVDLTQAVLAAIKARDGILNAYISVDERAALDQADQADAALRDGAQGTLLGVPLAIKDLLNVKGQPCTCASHMLEGYIAPYDATAIARLRAAGAIFLGRTNMDEFAMGSSTENSAFGVTRNPHNPEFVPGGSSGGSAAAVSGGEAIAAIGSDTGGSIRQPASFCGCVGLKPSYGRVSRYGLTAYASSLDQVGPLTRDVRDAALLLQVLAGGGP